MTTIRVNTGFTMIEMLLVLAVLVGTAFAVVVMAARSREDSQISNFLMAELQLEQNVKAAYASSPDYCGLNYPSALAAGLIPELLRGDTTTGVINMGLPATFDNTNHGATPWGLPFDVIGDTLRNSATPCQASKIAVFVSTMNQCESIMRALAVRTTVLNEAMMNNPVIATDAYAATDTVNVSNRIDSVCTAAIKGPYKQAKIIHTF